MSSNNNIVKVLLVNNYSMENAYNLWKKGTSGSHHVWGKVELDLNGRIDMAIFPHEKYRFLNQIGKWVGIKNLDQQVRLLLYKDYDILYAPYALANTSLLLLLKILGIYRKPIVILVHQPFLGTRSPKRLLRKITAKALLQFERSIFLSEKLMQDAIDSLEIPEKDASEKFATAQWGPDTEFYERVTPSERPLEECGYVVSAGHTDRDYITLIEAFRQIDFPLKIYCTPQTAPQVNNLPPHITINATRVPYIELLEIYQNARMILIPMTYPIHKEGCQGMTSVQDVVALGKPTIMTKNATLNLDVEKEGFGQYVEMGDVKGWVETTKALLYDFDRLYAMRDKARKTYQQKFNSEIFAATLEKELLDVASSQHPPRITRPAIAE